MDFLLEEQQLQLIWMTYKKNVFVGEYYTFKGVYVSHAIFHSQMSEGSKRSWNACCDGYYHITKLGIMSTQLH